MRNTYISKFKNGSAWPLLLLFFLMVHWAQAQETSSGNTTIFNGAQMTFFDTHDFTTGGAGTQPGVIYTLRTAPMGILNYGPSANTVTGANNANYVDGYVRKLGNTPFIFPVGDNNQYGPFAAQADGTTGAYFFGNATTAVTSMLPSGNYPVLPAGGPFSTAAMNTNLVDVSEIEYWDIDGTNPTPLTLTWDLTSAISTLTGADLPKLTIAGWNGTQWVNIDSKVDVTSILGGASSLTSGSITTLTTVVPNTYTAYTFASLAQSLPVTLTSFNALVEGSSTKLTWVTTAETNSDRFEVEHSLNGKVWNNIGTVKSQGESTGLKNYDFTHHTPQTGENLYRLKMIDLDKSFAYSRIQSIQMRERQKSLSVFPNPTTDFLSIEEYQHVKEVVIRDVSGRAVFQTKSVATGNGAIDVKGLPQGLYVVSVTRLGGNISTYKVLVNK